MSEKRASKSRNFIWVRILLMVLILAMILRSFFLESYRMPSSQMEAAVLCGDYIFVDKTAYGIRLPVTLLSVPFIPDSITLLGYNIKTYTDKLQLPYIRLFSKLVERNDVVVYNMPVLQQHVPLDKSPITISRCVGLPGDTIEVKGLEYYINGEKQAQSPDMILPYTYDESYDPQIKSIMRNLDIPYRQGVSYGDKKLRYLSRYELFLIKTELKDSVVFDLGFSSNLHYKLFIPGNGMTIKLTPESLHEYAQIILEQETNARIENEKLYINGRQTDFYKFKKDYYWMLSDNVNASADSRHYGFISHDHLLGRANWVWLSKQINGTFFSGYRWNRVLTKVN